MLRPDRRQRGKVRHEVVTMVRHRVHALALGYEDLKTTTPFATIRWCTPRAGASGRW